MSTPTNTFLSPIEIGPRDGARFQREIAVAGSENVYSVRSSTLLDMLGVDTQWESRFTLPGGGWEMLPMADGEPILGLHTLAALDLAADHDE